MVCLYCMNNQPTERVLCRAVLCMHVVVSSSSISCLAFIYRRFHFDSMIRTYGLPIGMYLCIGVYDSKTIKYPFFKEKEKNRREKSRYKIRRNKRYCTLTQIIGVSCLSSYVFGDCLPCCCSKAKNYEPILKHMHNLKSLTHCPAIVFVYLQIYDLAIRISRIKYHLLVFMCRITHASWINFRFRLYEIL